jgi:hypothetical protein
MIEIPDLLKGAGIKKNPSYHWISQRNASTLHLAVNSSPKPAAKFEKDFRTCSG